MRKILRQDQLNTCFRPINLRVKAAGNDTLIKKKPTTYILYFNEYIGMPIS